MNSSLPAQLGVAVEETRMSDESGVVAGIGRWQHGLHRHDHRLVQIIERSLQADNMFGPNSIIGVEPEYPIPGRMPQALIARRREVVAPRIFMKVGSKL